VDRRAAGVDRKRQLLPHAVAQDALVVRPRPDGAYNPDDGEAGAGDRVELVVDVEPFFGVLVGAALPDRSAAVELAM